MPQDQDNDNGAGVVRQAPTPGPLSAAIDMLSEARDFIDRFSDVRDGGYGVPEPNAAMVMVHEINATIEQLSAPTAPVEASGSERERIAVAIDPLIGGMDFSNYTPNSRMGLALMAADRVLALRPQPSGETREGRIVPQHSLEIALNLIKTAFPDELYLIEALSTAPFATTPARAEAQAEGAAGEPVAGWTYETERNCIRERHVILNRRDGKAKPPTKHHGETVHNVRPLYIRPSPPPAANEDRVREEGK